MRKELLVRNHLGLGDSLVINALVRHFAKDHEVCLLCKKHNQISLAFLFRDEPKICLATTDVDTMNDDDFADFASRHAEEQGKKVLRLGMYGDRKFYDKLTWDRSMYKQAGLDFQLRWNEFKCARQPSGEVPLPKGAFAFVHDDAKRGFKIPDERLETKLPIVRADPAKTNNIFAWWGVIEAAEEIHCIDSAFAILADSLPKLNARKLKIHLYARPNALPPSYRKDFEILKS